MAAAQRTLAEAYPGRFVLGIGVSHAPIVDARGHRYERPLERMRAYLDAGADHVCLQVLDADPNALPIGAWRSLAPALLGR